MTINDFLDRAVAVYPDRPAIIDEPNQVAPPRPTLTYADLADVRRQMGVAMDKMGIPFGARVAMVSHNAGRLLESFYGIAGNGRVFVPVNFRLSRPEVEYIVEHSGAVGLFIDPELADDLAGIECERTWILGEESDAAWLGHDGDPEPWEPDEDATASINYTSGTTARPKGVEQTHRARWTNAVTFGWHVGVSDRDVYLHTLPMFHCDGWGMLYTVSAMGVPHVVLRKVDGGEILRRVEKHGVTLMCGAPAVATAVLDAAKDWDGPIPGSGRVRIVVAGAPPPTAIIERVETELGWEFIQLYGLTETAPYLTMNRCRPEWDDLSPTERAQNLNRAGQPALGVDIKISESGEILARGNVILESYWEQPAETAAALEGGWFHTGDIVRADDDGYYYFIDRRKNVIRRSGENIAAVEVEAVLMQHPGIAACGVAPVPDEIRGDEVLACVVVSDDAKAGSEAEQQAFAKEVMSFCLDRLAYYKAPGYLAFVDKLPLTATQKVQRGELKKTAAACAKQALGHSGPAHGSIDLRELKKRNG